jgi:hypothetical protein
VYALELLLPAVGAGVIGLTAATPWLALAAVVVVVITVAGYRQVILAHPDGASCFSASRAHLGGRAPLFAGASLMVESALAIAVCLSAASALLTATVPAWGDNTLAVTVLAVLSLMLTWQTRPVIRTWTVLAPVAYMLCFIAMIAVGLGRTGIGGSGGTPVGETAASASGWLLVALIGRVLVASGLVLGGVERVSATVPDLPKPRARNAATALVAASLFAVLSLAGASAFARQINLGDLGASPAVLALAAAAFGAESVMYYAMGATAIGTLALAAWMALHRVERPVAAMARDGLLPGSWASSVDPSGSRWVILLVGLLAGGCVLGFGARTADLVALYAVAVFTTIAIGQLAMVQRCRATSFPPFDRAAHRRQRVTLMLTGVSAGVTTIVLALALATSVDQGGWVAPALIVVLSALMHGVQTHYVAVAAETAPKPRGVTQPTGVHGVVLVSHLDAASLRALSYARAARPDSLIALTISGDSDVGRTHSLVEQWNDRNIPVPLEILYARDDPGPPVVAYLENATRLAPDGVFEVFIPRLVVDRWWQRLLHNHDARRLRRRLAFVPGVMVTEVPLRLASSRIDAAGASSQPTWNRGHHGATGK